MPKATAKKICIVAMSLGGGGAERASGLLSQILVSLGHDVHIVSVMDNIEFPYSGKLLNLGKLKPEKNTLLSRLSRFRILKKYLSYNQFDFIIDTRTRIGSIKEYIISEFLFDSRRTIYMVHSSYLEAYLNPSRFLGRFLYGKAFRIVAVSKAIATKIEKVYKVKNVTTIYNAISLQKSNSEIATSKEANKFILFYGRLVDDIKNISLLIDAYSKSKLKDNKIKLRILGEGEDEFVLKQIVKTKDLMDYVEFLPHTNNPFQIVTEAYFVVLTSRYEGFPMVLVEALSLGTPVISVDCETGPNEIISHEENGLLVPNNNSEALAKAMNRFVDDKKLYLHCKGNAVESVKRFSVEGIGKQWNNLLN